MLVTETKLPGGQLQSLMEDNPELLQFDPRYIFMKEMLSRSLPDGIYNDQDQEQDDPSEGEQDTEDFDWSQT